MSNETDKNYVIINDLRPLLKNFNEDLGIYINNEDRYKLGRVLTIIDAAIADPEQRKAIKDLVNGEWWGKGYKVSEGYMTNPHTDIRGLCLALGFELYESGSTAPDDPSTATNDREESYSKKRYQDILKSIN